jgi:SAM-dependent methyltransferase
MDLKEADILGCAIRDHWYYISKGRAIRKILGNLKVPEVLDVGAGSGIFSRQLLDEGYCETAVCLDTNYPSEKIEIHNGKKIFFVKSIDRTSQKLVLMMDVLEHVSNDLALLTTYTQDLERDDLVLITVPAFQFLWSSHDVFLEHHRRYTIRMIEDVIVKAGMTPVKSRYFFGGLFPVVAGIRLLKKFLLGCGVLKAKSELKVYPAWLNKTLVAIHDLERNTLFGINKFFGLSLFVLCRKN